MRKLSEEVAARRKRELLQWVVHYFIRTSRPVASQAIAADSGMGLSSATIRSALQELEDEGYLVQPHTSSGRQPTDKGYRFFVDYLADVQRLASEEKERIEGLYKNRIEELDTLLAETSRLLSKSSHAAGLVLSANVRDQALKRLEIIPLGGRKVLAIVVTEGGLVRHWPIELEFPPSARQVNVLNRFLNDSIRGLTLGEARSAVLARLRQLERDFQEMSRVVGDVLQEAGALVSPGTLYVDGADNILSRAEELGDLKAVQGLMRLLEEKRTLAGLMEEEIVREGAGGTAAPRVRIGRETGIRALSGLSLITTAYKHKERVVGVIGILGSKRMEYPRMMGLVNAISAVVSARLKSWDEDGRTRAASLPAPRPKPRPRAREAR